VTQTPSNQPSRSDRLKPLELISISAGMALFVGLTILLTTREVVLSGVGFGITFIIALVTIAMLVMSIKPNASERDDLDEQNNH